MIDVTIDLSRCQGYGNCVSAAPDVIDINDDGQAFLIVEEIGDEREAELRDAAAVCPVAAIAIARQ